MPCPNSYQHTNEIRKKQNDKEIYHPSLLNQEINKKKSLNPFITRDDVCRVTKDQEEKTLIQSETKIGLKLLINFKTLNG